ncbi:hypothetical protein [Streptomyces sp. enrichment culture]|uniref:hypothetical protein n=1 Tax=Streptomyces sp. enrichment culture TaxID=1795815 RepID=UPI003F554414
MSGLAADIRSARVPESEAFSGRLSSWGEEVPADGARAPARETAADIATSRSAGIEPMNRLLGKG